MYMCLTKMVLGWVVTVLSTEILKRLKIYRVYAATAGRSYVGNKNEIHK